MRMGRILAVALATLCCSTLAYATHIPASGEVIVYDGTLNPGVATTGTIGWVSPEDGYDWFCFNTTSGTAVTIKVTRTSGDIVPNTGIMSGLAEAGGTATLTQLAASDNPDAATVTLNYAPTATGLVTLWISTFLGEDGGSYTVTMTGGTPGSCTGTTIDDSVRMQVVFDSAFDVDPVLTGNSRTVGVPFQTQINASTFDHDIALSVTTDAEPWETVTATVTPAIIRHPGNGTGTVSVTTGPLTFPRLYRATIHAQALNDNGVPTGETDEASVLLDVQCTPPFILGSDQPKSISANNGTQVQLEVKPSGTGPFFYQWFTGYPGQVTTPVQAANEPQLIFTTRASNTYYVRVTNACGSVNSLTTTVTTIGTLTNVRRRSGS